MLRVRAGSVRVPCGFRAGVFAGLFRKSLRACGFLAGVLRVYFEIAAGFGVRYLRENPGSVLISGSPRHWHRGPAHFFFTKFSIPGQSCVQV